MKAAKKAAPIAIVRVCVVKDCARPMHTKGLCHLHYQRQRLNRPLVRPLTAPVAECIRLSPYVSKLNVKALAQQATRAGLPLNTYVKLILERAGQGDVTVAGAAPEDALRAV